MKLADLLFKSSKHQNLFHLLFVQGEELSGFALSELTALPYATIHAELERLKSAGLLKSQKVGRSVLYRSIMDEATVNLLARLLGSTVSPSQASSPPRAITDELVRASLQGYGAPLILESLPEGAHLQLEEAVVRGALLAKTDPVVARVLPVVLSQNAKKLDSGKLLVLSRKLRAKQELGFLIALTYELSRIRKLGELARKLKDNRIKDERDFFAGQKSSAFQKQLTERNTPKLAKKWKFRMNMSLETFRSTFERFNQAAGE